MTFPAQDVPGAGPLVAHHFTYLSLAAILVCLVLWDDHRGAEPIGVVGGLTTALFAFIFMWGQGWALGAALTLVGLSVATAALVTMPVWRKGGDVTYPRLYRLTIAMLLAGAWDDVLEHAFGWPTPLDWLWKHGLWCLAQMNCL